MDQELLKTNLNGLERKLLVLVNEHKSLKEELKALKTENQELKSAIKTRDEQITSFHNQLKITKIVDNLHPEDGSVSELKKKVDEYIREIAAVETMRDEAADCLQRHFVTVTAEEDARHREFDARLVKATGWT
jgi:chromosome segregation ATPase